MENQTEKIVMLDPVTAAIVNEKAEKEGVSPKEALRRIVKQQMDELNAERKQIDCSHCPKNKNAEKPLAKMAHIKLTPLSDKVINQVAKQYGVDKDCFVCVSIANFFNLSDNQKFEFLKNKPCN